MKKLRTKNTDRLTEEMRILAVLIMRYKTKQRITGATVFNQYGIYRLSALILKLRKKHINIDTVMMTSPVTGKQYGDYKFSNYAMSLHGSTLYRDYMKAIREDNQINFLDSLLVGYKFEAGKKYPAIYTKNKIL